MEETELAKWDAKAIKLHHCAHSAPETEMVWILNMKEIDEEKFELRVVRILNFWTISFKFLYV